MSALLLLLFFVLLLAATAYFLSGWIGRRMRAGVSPLAPYGLTFVLLLGFLRVEGLPGERAGLIEAGACAAAIGLAWLDRRRRRVSVFGEDSAPLPPQRRRA